MHLTSKLFCFVLIVNFGYCADITTFVKSYRYPIEEYTNVITKDGYILKLYRIPYGRNGSGTNVREPVLLVHPLGESAEMYVFLDPEKSLGFLLPDRGYDVWLVNIRANSYSRKHVKLDPDRDKEFWNFTLTELSLDITASIDYVLNATGFEQLFYVGHSQGAALFFILASEYPEYNEKIKLSILLSPPVFIGNIPNPFIQLMVASLEPIKDFAEAVGLYDIHPLRDFSQAFGSTICSPLYFAHICKLIAMITSGWNPNQMDIKYMPRIANNVLEGMGLYELIHLLQQVRTNKFQKYDYGKSENLLRYGSEQPPEYNLSNVVAPVAIYYSEGDIIVNVKGVRKLVSILPNVVDAYQVSDKYFTHIDFIVATDIVPLLYGRVLNLMEKYRINNVVHEE